jgi:predicted esterase
MHNGCVKKVLLPAATAHGRVVIDAADSASGAARGILVAFHGYAQNADDALEEIRRIPGAESWHLAAVQALHRFYGRAERVVASWMTREDREIAIADNVRYVDAALEAVIANVPATGSPQAPLVLFGFSQGVAMAYRCARLGRFQVAGVIALAGDIPPELAEDASRSWPPVLIGAGDADSLYTAEKLAADEALLEARGVAHRVARFTGGHESTDAFRRSAGEWLRDLGRPAS